MIFVSNKSPHESYVENMGTAKLNLLPNPIYCKSAAEVCFRILEKSKSLESHPHKEFLSGWVMSILPKIREGGLNYYRVQVWNPLASKAGMDVIETSLVERETTFTLLLPPPVKEKPIVKRGVFNPKPKVIINGETQSIQASPTAGASSIGGEEL